jgi:acyl-CoA synthetase (AMP-forming)/AMP-acid ligase II
MLVLFVSLAASSRTLAVSGRLLGGPWGCMLALVTTTFQTKFPKRKMYVLSLSFSCVEIVFLRRSIPEMGYDATSQPPEGEVCLRGPGVFLGYHKRPELTQQDYCALPQRASATARPN